MADDTQTQAKPQVGITLGNNVFSAVGTGAAGYGATLLAEPSTHTLGLCIIVGSFIPNVAPYILSAILQVIAAVKAK